ENETLLRQPPENYEPLGMKLTSGAGVGDFNDRRSNNDTIGFPADERIWESVIAAPRFVGKQLAELKLYPISLGYKKPRPQRGWPQLSLLIRRQPSSYPLVTVVFTLLLIGIAATWDRGDRTSASRIRFVTPAAVIVAVLAAAIMMFAAYRWTRILAWQPYGADMLIVIREA